MADYAPNECEGCKTELNKVQAVLDELLVTLPAHGKEAGHAFDPRNPANGHAVLALDALMFSAALWCANHSISPGEFRQSAEDVIKATSTMSPDLSEIKELILKYLDTPEDKNQFNLNDFMDKGRVH